MTNESKTNEDQSRSFFQSVKPYLEKGPLVALLLGISSGFPFAMIGATLTSWLAGLEIKKSSITTFALVILMYNLKFLWAWIIESVHIPVLGRLGQRVSWMLVAGTAVILAVINLGHSDPAGDLYATAYAAILVGIAGATFDIVIDAYRIETLQPHQLGTGSGMSQYGWRVGAAAAGWLALKLSMPYGWAVAYMACAALALPAMLTALFLGEPPRHKELKKAAKSWNERLSAVGDSIYKPLSEFFRRRGAFLVLVFILLHKIGDTLANLTLRILFKDVGFTPAEVADYDVNVGFWALIIGVFIGGILYARLGLKRSVFLSLVLMGVSNLGFAWLAMVGHDNFAMASVVAFENFCSGIGGVTVVAYFSALCNLSFTATQYALISAAASVVGRIATGTTAGAMMEEMGNVNFYLFTTIIALPGIVLFWFMMRAGLIDQSIGDAGTKSYQEK